MARSKSHIDQPRQRLTVGHSPKLRVSSAGLLRAVYRVGIAIVAGCVISAALNFPRSHDLPLTGKEIEETRQFYTNAYKRTTETKSEAEVQYMAKYEAIAEYVSHRNEIKNKIGEFVRDYQLDDKAILDVGSGRGHLQDLVQNYTGLDISSSVAPLYHKRFVLGSATAMPFADNSFDAAWSIYVFEHVPNPEQALAETRRVIRDGGLFFLMAGWNCGSWLANGYMVRPYSDFDLTGKLIKVSVPIRASSKYRAATVLPVRPVRATAALFGPTTLRYNRLTPNYEIYWQPDSDALNSIDSHEALIWFLSRGDECLNCNGPDLLLDDNEPIIIRIRK